MVERQARGQVDEWRSIGAERVADPELEIRAGGKAAVEVDAESAPSYAGVES